MKDIKDTPLFTEGHRNTLRPCPIHNTENLMELGKHSHKFLVFTCTECGKRDVRNNNAVTHKTANVCCRFCMLKNAHERTLNNMLYDYIEANYGLPFEYLEIQKVVKRFSKDKFKYDMFVGKDFNTVIELDDDTHVYNKLTRFYDIIKMQIAKSMGYKVIRIYLNKKDEFSKELQDQIIDQLEKNRNEEPGYDLVILNDNKGKLNNLKNI